MKDEKYYTPEISEFHVGFEYDTLGKELNASNGRYEDIWRKSVVDDDDGDIQNPFDNFNCGIQTQTIRVKHLDREDIESLGLEYIDWRDLRKTTGQYVEIYEIEFNKNKYSARYYQLTTDSKNNTIDIIERDGRDGNVMRVLFSGTINNKSELKRILKQLGI